MPLNNDFADQNCSVARTLEVIGERWSMLVIRDIYLGIRRFDEIQRHLGISRNVLTARLTHLVDLGVLKRVLYSERPERYEYKLTSRGRDLWPVLLAMIEFGDKHAPPPGGPARLFTHKGCGGTIDKRHVRCEKCGEDVSVFDTVGEVGPGYTGPKGEFGPLETAAPAAN